MITKNRSSFLSLITDPLKNWLAYPLTKDMDLDSPDLTELRVKVIQEKAFLKQIYEEWYAEIRKNLPPVVGPVLELGSGAGFLNKYIPDLVTSEVFLCSSVQMVLDGRALPFESNTFRAIVMTDVFHHIPDVQSFLSEAERCLVKGGSIIMVEPWVTRWSGLIFRYIHHEPFVPDTPNWNFPPEGPLSSANEALPWIVFQRDKDRFLSNFPNFKIQKVTLTMPFRYLLSGGLAWRSFSPGWSFGFWKNFESLIERWQEQLAMFAIIRVDKVN